MYVCVYVGGWVGLLEARYDVRWLFLVGFRIKRRHMQYVRMPPKFLGRKFVEKGGGRGEPMAELLVFLIRR